MTFNTAVSGLRAADVDLSVIGNNIANASTTGFKQSRAEFVDVYATASLGSGVGYSVGSGVSVSRVSQQFSQGNIAFTNNPLDMAINGKGFFVVEDDGGVEFTRNGIFGVDQNGFVTNAQNKRLQGFQANENGAVSGEVSDLQVTTDNLSPRQTTGVSAVMNLDASEVAPEERGTSSVTEGPVIGIAQPAVTNGYPVETLTFSLEDGTTRTITTVANNSAEATASAINALPTISATATTQATLSGIGDNSGNMTMTLNGVTIADSTGPGTVTPQEIAIAINNLTNTTLRGISATFDAVAGTVQVTSNFGADISFRINNTGDATDGFTLTGPNGAAVAVDGNNTAGNGFAATVGGAINVTMEDGTTLSTDGGGVALFDDPLSQSPFVNNSFDPDNQETYNHATSVNVFDSLGNAHVMTMFFVKEGTGTANPNTWSLYLQIDGEDIGDPNSALPAPDNTFPTQARFSLVFDSDGTLDEGASDPVQITYWNPIDADGNNNGALTGLTLAQGATFPLLEPYTSSNFEIDISDITQYGNDFAVNDLTQDGYTTGRLTNIDIDPEGVMFARYTNGQSRVLGQVALANFRNEQGLKSAGESTWVETFSSGNPTIGNPGSASLGVIQAGATEESNVELSNELVSLIEAQRNFQANAQTIRTADTVTQAIINIR
jgi:flagellar hook protein FlgE